MSPFSGIDGFDLGFAQAEPVSFAMENVLGLATMKDDKAIREVCQTFATGGYHVSWDVLNAANYGVPQQRERAFVFGRRVDVMAGGRPAPTTHQCEVGRSLTS